VSKNTIYTKLFWPFAQYPLFVERECVCAKRRFQGGKGKFHKNGTDGFNYPSDDLGSSDGCCYFKQCIFFKMILPQHKIKWDCKKKTKNACNPAYARPTYQLTIP